MGDKKTPGVPFAVDEHCLLNFRQTPVARQEIMAVYDPPVQRVPAEIYRSDEEDYKIGDS